MAPSKLEVPSVYKDENARQIYYFLLCVMGGHSTVEEVVGYIAYLMRPEEADIEGDELYDVNLSMTEDMIWDCLNEPDIATAVHYIIEIWAPYTLEPLDDDSTAVEVIDVNMEMDPDLRDLLNGL